MSFQPVLLPIAVFVIAAVVIHFPVTVGEVGIGLVAGFLVYQWRHRKDEY